MSENSMDHVVVHLPYFDVWIAFFRHIDCNIRDRRDQNDG